MRIEERHVEGIERASFEIPGRSHWTQRFIDLFLNFVYGFPFLPVRSLKRVSVCFLVVDEKVSMECRSPIGRQHSGHYRTVLCLGPSCLINVM
ncbi:hypothetical protein CR513_60823, partial [Mucuna pruriens]